MFRSVLAAVAGIALLSVMDAVVKSLVASVPVLLVAFLRYAIGSAVMVGLVAATGAGWPRPDTWRANSLRAIAVVVTAVSFFYGLGQLPLAETLILTFLSPIVTSVLAALLLGEALDRRVGAALAAGFSGVVVIVAGGQTGGDEVGRPWLGVVAVLVSTVSYSASMVLLRARALRDPLLHIVLIQNVVPAFFLAVPAVLTFRSPVGAEWPKLVAVACLGTVGHLLMARAYAGAPAVRLAPLDFTALLWAAGIGFVVYGEVPGPAVLAGGAAIVVGVLAIGRR